MRSSALFVLFILIVCPINVIHSDDEPDVATSPSEDVTVKASDETTTAAEGVTTEASAETTAGAEGETTETTTKSTKSSKKSAAKGTTTPLPDTTTENGNWTKSEKLKNKYKIFKTKAIIYGKQKAKQLMDILNFDISKLDVRNLTQFLPFYDGYKKLFNKKYANDNETNFRMSFFKRSVETIKEHNKNLKARYQKGINELSDMNFMEIIGTRLGLKRDNVDVMVKASAPVPPVEDMPKEWDWRKFGVLTPPRNQGKCGSCWSFAAATVLESHNMKRLIAEGKFDPKQQITVSEQNLIDCSADFGTIGCDGGMPQQAFKYVSANKGINGVDAYPYKGVKEKCVYNAAKRVDVEVKEGKRLKTGMDDHLATAIYNYGPVAIAIHVTKDMAAYKSGIFEDPKCDAKRVNHAVVAVGYSPEFFIIRNSWGPNWGEEGYIKIARSKVNNCGVSQQGYYPVVPNAVETQAMRDRLREV